MQKVELKQAFFENKATKRTAHLLPIFRIPMCLFRRVYFSIKDRLITEVLSTLKQWFLNWGNLPSEGKLQFLGG